MVPFPLFKRPVFLRFQSVVYPTPVSELFRCKAFWFRGLGRKLGQRFAVCGGNSSMAEATRLLVMNPSRDFASSFSGTRRLTRHAGDPFLCRLKAETQSESDNCYAFHAFSVLQMKEGQSLDSL
jgi:hypothetical protein